MANPIVTITMENGDVMKAELYPDVAPITVENFVNLVKDGFYDGLRKLGLFEQTGVDLPGEANSIFHKQEKVQVVLDILLKENSARIV